MSLHICAATKTPCQSPLTCSKHEDCPKRTDFKAMQMLGAPACVIGSALAGQSPAAVRKENDQFSRELDRLRAENAGLKTGCEAYERVNAGLNQRIANLELCQAASLGVSGIIKSGASELGFDAVGEDSALDYLIGLARPAAELRAECEALRNRQSFSDAFYEVTGLLGVAGARPEAPLVVFRQEVVPALQAVIRNSKRYEWLKQNATVMLKKTVSYTTSLGLMQTCYPSAMEVDAALDAAMSEEQSHD